MTKVKAKKSSVPSGVFLPGTDLREYLEQRGDLRALFDRVHAHFFEGLGEPQRLDEEPRRDTSSRAHSKGGPHAQSHSR